MKKILAGVAALLLLLSSCSFSGGDGDTQDAVPTPTPTEELLPAQYIPPAVPNGDGKFSLRYNPNATLNPYVGTDVQNMALTTLMYESLFVLGADMTPQNYLCEAYTTEDSISYTFTFLEGVLMNDGSEMSPYDIVYSINLARNSERYRERLKNIASVQVADTRTVTVTQYSADAHLPALLDIPIIKDGSSGTAPRGSGPYKYLLADDVAQLVRNEHYRLGAFAAPIDTIYLVDCAYSELGEYFTEQIIDLFAEDPNARPASVRRDHEVRYYNTTVLQYIGFNPRTIVIEDIRFRRAVALAVDRDKIVNDILGTRAIAAQLILPSYYRLYDTTWESEVGTVAERRVAMSRILDEIGLRDNDNNMYLEFPVSGELVPFALDFIVSSENETRVAAAKSVSDALRYVGIDVIFRPLPFDEFTAELEAGNYDICYGEVRLPPSLDPATLVAPGGALNFGAMGGENYPALLADYRAASDDFSEKNAARELCAAIAADVSVIPVVYKQHAVHSGRGEVSGIEPSQTGVFVNIADWTIKVN